MASRTIALLRQHPLSGYFLLAFLTWSWEIPTFAIWHTPFMPGPWMFIAPISAGLAMAWITEGPSGMLRLLRRCLVWRVGIGGYAVALLTMPMLYLLGLIAVPGALAAFRIPGPAFLALYLSSFAFHLFGAGLAEEPGWRGYALPRLQRRYGPLRGTLMLGSRWAIWHLHSGCSCQVTVGRGRASLVPRFPSWAGRYS
jgi:membrane protease YdiL (CAAX protease family)